MSVAVQTVPARTIAAVRRSVAVGAVGAAWKPALDQVWAFLRENPGLRTDGHNVFLYHHPERRGEPMEVDFGVEVTRAFPTAGNVVATATPAGEVATTVHVGGYDRLNQAHEAIQAWCTREGRTLAGTSWEIYGDWSEDPSKMETTIYYLLR
jgi:effector-binding domain-containing protein